MKRHVVDLERGQIKTICILREKIDAKDKLKQETDQLKYELRRILNP
jgi:hypothetical protein